MISHLSGIVLKTRNRQLILNVQNVGYAVFVSKNLLAKTESKQSLELWIHTHQTSDAISLFGFISEKELDFFELLTSVNGVGPKTALDLLENSVEVLENIIVSGDAKALSQIKGIGAKTAARIVLELKSKITGADPEVPINKEINEEAISALVQLGWKKSEIEKLLVKLPAKITEAEEIVKWVLQGK